MVTNRGLARILTVSGLAVAPALAVFAVGGHGLVEASVQTIVPLSHIGYADPDDPRSILQAAIYTNNNSPESNDLVLDKNVAVQTSRMSGAENGSPFHHATLTGLHRLLGHRPIIVGGSVEDSFIQQTNLSTVFIQRDNLALPLAQLNTRQGLEAAMLNALNSANAEQLQKTSSPAISIAETSPTAFANVQMRITYSDDTTAKATITGLPDSVYGTSVLYASFLDERATNQHDLSEAQEFDAFTEQLAAPTKNYHTLDNTVLAAFNAANNGALTAAQTTISYWDSASGGTDISDQLQRGDTTFWINIECHADSPFWSGHRRFAGTSNAGYALETPALSDVVEYRTFDQLGATHDKAAILNQVNVRNALLLQDTDINITSNGTIGSTLVATSASPYKTGSSVDINYVYDHHGHYLPWTDSTRANPTYSILTDHSHGFYVGSAHGLYDYDPTNPATSKAPVIDASQTAAVFSTAWDGRGHLWVASQKRLIDYNPSQPDNLNIFFNGANVTSVQYNAVNNKVYALVNNDLMEVEPGTVFSDNYAPVVTEARAMTIDSAGNVWAVTTNGLYKYVAGQDAVLVAGVDTNKTGPLTALYAASDGTIFVGSTHGLFIYSPVSATLSEPLFTETGANFVGGFTTDLNNNLYIGASNGMWIYNTYDHLLANDGHAVLESAIATAPGYGPLFSVDTANHTLYMVDARGHGIYQY